MVARIRLAGLILMKCPQASIQTRCLRGKSALYSSKRDSSGLRDRREGESFNSQSESRSLGHDLKNVPAPGQLPAKKDKTSLAGLTRQPSISTIEESLML